MTESLMPPEYLNMLQPSLVAPIVTLLSHDSNTTTGECYEVGGGWFSKVRLQRTCGVFLSNSGEEVTAEHLVKRIDEVRDFNGPNPSVYPTTVLDAIKSIVAARGRRKRD